MARLEPRFPLALLAVSLSACLDGQAAAWPDGEWPAAFLLESAPNGAVSVFGPFAIPSASESPNLPLPFPSRTDREVRLIALDAASFTEIHPWADPTQGLQARLVRPVTGACEAQLVSADRSRATAPLPPSTRRFLLDRTSAQFEPIPEAEDDEPAVQLALEDEPCPAPAHLQTFGVGERVIREGAWLGGEARSSTSDNEEWFSVQDGEHLTADLALITISSGLCLLERGGEITTDESPRVLNRAQLPNAGEIAWVFRRAEVDWSRSGRGRYRIVAAARGCDEPLEVGCRKWSFLIAHIELSEAGFSLVHTSTHPGDFVDLTLDPMGVAIAVTKSEQIVPGRIHVITSSVAKPISYELGMSTDGKQVRSSPDLQNPHLVLSSQSSVRYGDFATRAPVFAPIEPPVEDARGDSGFSMSAVVLDDGVHWFVGGERSLLLHRDPSTNWERLSPSYDRHAALYTGDTRCGAGDLPEELGEQTIAIDQQGALWLFQLPRAAPIVAAVRVDLEQGQHCGTIVPGEISASGIARRTLTSMRVNHDQTRALLTGKDGRVMEMIFDGATPVR